MCIGFINPTSAKRKIAKEKTKAKSKFRKQTPILILVLVGRQASQSDRVDFNLRGVGS